MKNNSELYKIAVTPPSVDNIGQILSQMRFFFKTYDTYDLENPGKVEDIDILFINCTGISTSRNSIKNVRKMVSRGGACYISCYASDWIDETWPGYVKFHHRGRSKKKIVGEVVHEGLMEFLGQESIDLHYNTSWHGVRELLSSEVVEYLRGWRGKHEEPLLVSFPYGDGLVVFTTFHNSVQKSEVEQKLLQYLVLMPMTATTTHESTEVLMQQQFVPSKENIGSLGSGEESKLYSFNLSRPDYDLKYVFNWKGEAHVQLTIFDPSNTMVVNEMTQSSPWEIDIPNASTGIWTYKLKIIDAPLQNFPYTINVGCKPSQYLGRINVPQSGTELMMECVYPIQAQLGRWNLIPGTPVEVGRESFPSEIPMINMVSRQHFRIIKDSESNDITIIDISSNGTMVNGMPIAKDVPVKFSLPVTLKLAGVVIVVLKL